MKSKVILAVDDSKTQLTFLQIALERGGFTVITADNGLEGVAKAFVEKPDLVISDIQMPELSGYQLCRLLKNNKETQDTPIILLTSLDQPQDKFWGIRAGADKYIVKSSNYDQLIETTHTLLGKSLGKKQRTQSPQQENKNLDLPSLKSSLNYLLDKLLFETTLSNEANRLANFIYSRDDLMKEASKLISSLIDYTCLCLCLDDAHGIVMHYDLRQSISESELYKTRDTILSSVSVNTTHKENVGIRFITGSMELEETTNETIKSHLCIPLTLHENSLGSLSVFSTKNFAFNQEATNIIQLLSRDLPMVFKLMLLYDETKRLAITDGLTGLYNNRYFKEIFQLEFERAKRYKLNLSFLMIDIDHFKPINDTYGHLQGDHVIREIGVILKENIRRGDFAARYGGEEFAVLAFDTELDQAASIAEKMRSRIENLSFSSDQGDLQVTISIGVASIHEDTLDIFDLIKKADDALYRAKTEGRNRVCVHTIVVGKKKKIDI